MVVDTLDEDSQAALGACSRYWQELTQPYVYPTPMGVHQALRRGNRHLLGRLWQTPRDGSAHLITGVADDDGMTAMMHAAAHGDAALLRCLIRHNGPNMAQVDRGGLTAEAWACLTGHEAAFTRARLETKSGCRVGTSDRIRHTLHDAIACGHWRLTRTLLRPHYTRLLRTDLPFLRPGYAMDKRLSCQLLAAACAEAHAPQDRPLAGVFLREADDPPHTAAQLATLGAHLDPRRPDWAHRLRVLVRCGFDINAVPCDARITKSYLHRWLRDGAFDMAAVQRLDEVCQGTVLADTAAGRAVLRACLRAPRYAKAAEHRPVITALLARGVRVDGDIDATARRIAYCEGLDPALWGLLAALGADVHACDARDRSLAHASLPKLASTGRSGTDTEPRAADYDRSVASLVLLASLGLDVQKRDALGTNPVHRCVLQNHRLHRNVLPQLLAAGIRLDAPGAHPVGNINVEAHTLLEVALLIDDQALATWFLTHDIACSPRQLRDAYRRLSAADVPWPKAWFKRRCTARSLGLRGAYLVDINPAGACHAKLSPGRLYRALEVKQADAAATASGPQRFWAVVQRSALEGAVTARRAAKPLTRQTDRVFGTQLVYAARRAGAETQASGTQPAGDRHAALRKPFVQSAALVGCVPKAFISGAGLTAGALVGCVKGAALGMSFKKPMDDVRYP